MSHYPVDGSDPAVVARALVYLHQKLSGKCCRVDEHLLDESIEDALLRHLGSPERFDAARGVPLSYYLELWSRSFLDLKLRKEKRCRKHEKAAGVSGKIFENNVSELREERCIYIGRNRSEQEVEEHEEKVERQRQLLNAIVAHLHPHDRDGVQLLRAGASFEKWVQHLGIEDLPCKEQKRKVYAEKDRLMKKLKRWAQKMPGGGE